MTAPSVVVLGGPNGSGKSTAAVRLLRETLEMMEFVNADVIAQGLSAFNPSNVAFSAGRIMLRRLDDLANAGADFALETTLATRSLAPWIASLKEGKGYTFRLVYFWLQTVELNVTRVKSRVLSGGHGIPEEVIRRRYLRSIRNLFDFYMPIATTWEVFDNSAAEDPQIVAAGGEFEPIQIYLPDRWSTLRSYYEEAGTE